MSATRSGTPFALIALIAIAAALLWLVLKLILSILWALFVIVAVVLGAGAIGLVIATRLQKR